MACCGPAQGQGPSTDVKDNDVEDTHDAAAKTVDDVTANNVASEQQAPSGAAVADAIVDVADARPSAIEVVDARPATGASEVDANPISWPRVGPREGAISVPTPRDSLAYDLSGLKRAIIFNQKTFSPRLKLNPRNGTEVDVKSIQSTFKSLDWEVITHTDSTAAQIRDIILKQVQLCEDELAAIAIFILSHGEDNGTIFASDYPFRVDHDVLAQLTGDKCPSLVGRPKLLFVQACQGQETDQGVSVTDRRRRHTSQDSQAAYKIPNHADFLIFQASFWDHFSFRSSETGSWFIQALCDKIDRSSASEPLMDVLLTVSASVALNKESNVPGRPNLDKKKQVPLLYSTMLRKMYLKGHIASSKPSGGDPTVQDSSAVAEAFSGLKLEDERGRAGSLRSLPRGGGRDRDKDCSLM